MLYFVLIYIHGVMHPVLCCVALHCIALYCIALRCIVLYCIVLETKIYLHDTNNRQELKITINGTKYREYPLVSLYSHPHPLPIFGVR